MALTFSKTATTQVAEMADVVNTSAPFCLESNKDFDTQARGDGYTMLIDPPDVGVVNAGAKITDDTVLSIARTHQIPLTLAQANTGVQFVATDGMLYFKEDSSIMGMRAQNLASSTHKKVTKALGFGITAHVATAGKELSALATATASIRKHRGSGEIIGGFNADVMPALYEDSAKKFVPDAISQAMYKDASLGKFATASWFETQDIENYTWVQGLTGTPVASVTFDSTGKCASVVFSAGSLTGTVLDGTPFKIADLKTTDLLGNATAYDAVLYAKGTATASGNSVTVELEEPIYNVGNRKNVSASGNLSSKAVTFLLTTAKTYAKAVVYSKVTNIFRQADLPTIMGATSVTCGDGTKDIKLTCIADGLIKDYSNVMRIDVLTGNAVAYSQLCHTVFFQLN